MSRRTQLERDYMDNVGHEPPLDDSEEAWQWDYRGGKADRERLAKLLEQRRREEAEAERPEQESLF